MEENLLFGIILLITSFLYSSIGHGGASGYLALMALFSYPTFLMKPTALLFNIFVAGISFLFFKKANHFKWKLFYPFAITSIPFSFLGGLIKIDTSLYKQILGIFLLIAVLRILLPIKNGTKHFKHSILLSLLIGAIIGLFSGMIGIGGGIILSPIIILLGLGNLKETAAVSALFILVNSIAGLTGLVINSGEVFLQSFYILPFVIVGGILGAVYGSRRFNFKTLNYILTLILFFAGIKLFLF